VILDNGSVSNIHTHTHTYIGDKSFIFSKIAVYENREKDCRKIIE